VTIYACLIPSSVEAPTKVSTTKTSIEIAWTEPESNGCAITGFTILRDDGAGSDVTISVDPSTVQNLPSLREYDITGLSGTGSSFRIKIRAHNHAGTTDSDPLVVVLAAVPDTPASGPSSDAEVTDKT